MKKLLLSFIIAFVSLAINAEEHHFKFMRIPLDGNIDSFQKELYKKGFTLDKSVGKIYDGVCVYNGTFAGEKSQVFVKYDVKTKIVYQASVVITNYNKESAISSYKNMRDMLEDKYSQEEGVKSYIEMMNGIGKDPSKWIHTQDRKGYEQTDFVIPDSETRNIVGIISIYIAEHYSQVSLKDEFNLYINYVDWVNDDLRRENIIDDL